MLPAIDTSCRYFSGAPGTLVYLIPSQSHPASWPKPKIFYQKIFYGLSSLLKEKAIKQW
ncbi:hypothetical protein J0A67_17245 [Algoriphagus aestuariicola]|uniref:Uncharacterized protein n=1 Tax=Algoriphagus aestuariicola TaxID=1852016 RepID=A0ABS3BU89_9BACT|nr:hypothetical protein [Algoriphagus aestuariicola]MBN7802625.1 hypothetical protein [Algoriphagus aestuariicola]